MCAISFKFKIDLRGLLCTISMQSKGNVEPIFLGIAGGAMSGKTHVADLITNRILTQLGYSVTVISQDWFYRNAGDVLTINYEAPDAFNFERILNTLIMLKTEPYACIHITDCDGEVRGKSVVVPTPLIIFEGTYAFYDPRIAALMSYKMFVDCDADTMLIRRIRQAAGDADFSLDSTLSYYSTFVKPALENWIEPQRRAADIVIQSNNVFTPRVVTEIFCSLCRDILTRDR